MTSEELKALIEGVADGSISAEEAVRRLKHGPLRHDELAYANLDHHRHLRQGLAEVVYGEGKTTEEILEIAVRPLEELRGAAESDSALMPPIIEAVRARATVGEISDALRAAWGSFRPPA